MPFVATVKSDLVRVSLRARRRLNTEVKAHAKRTQTVIMGSRLEDMHNIKCKQLQRHVAFRHLKLSCTDVALHLPGKIARLIGDIRTLVALCELIEHELEKRIVARHICIKIDSFLELCPRYKNELKRLYGSSAVRVLEDLLNGLRKDYEGSDLPLIRDAMSAHALKLDLSRAVEATLFAGQTVMTILADDVEMIEAALKVIAGRHHVAAGKAQVDDAWVKFWEQDDCLGDPARPRVATIYTGLATAGVVSPIAGGASAQDTYIRAVSVATNQRQCRLMLEATPVRSNAERLFAEMILNDYLAFWELLFVSGVRNEYGVVDLSVLEHWEQDQWKGAEKLRQILHQPHPNLELWRTQRNRTTAHLDPDCEIRLIDIDNWPMNLPDLINESSRLIEKVKAAASLDVRSRILFIPPTQLGPNVIGLAAQEDRRWDG